MRWFSRMLLASLYPGAPFERKFLAMLLLDTLLNVWSTADKAIKYSAPGNREYDAGMADLLAMASAQGIELLCPGFLGPKTVQVAILPPDAYSLSAIVLQFLLLLFHASCWHHIHAAGT